MRISHVPQDTLGARIGLKAGDTILSVNGSKPRDIIDLSFIIAEPKVSMMVLDGSTRMIRRLEVEKDPYGSLGVEFERAVFDGIITCRNRCIFCFVDQMPQGFRESLYVKDDDYRLSFLQGSFITLNALRESDIGRIVRHHLSPLYVSVHSTDPRLRSMMMGRGAGDLVGLLRRLIRHDIRVHAQFVLCPKVNDGAALHRSLEELWGLGSAIASVGIVPVGLTRFREGLYPLEPYDSERAAEVLEMVSHWQRRALSERGDRWAYCADEFYLMTGSGIPEDSFYGKYPQLQNGIGLVRTFLNGWEDALESFRASRGVGGGWNGGGTGARAVSSAHLAVGGGGDMPGRPFSVGVVTGEAFAPFLRVCIERLKALRADCPPIEVVPVPNLTFGGNVSAAGLLTARDIVLELKRRRLRSDKLCELLIPAVSLRDGRFLDDRTIAWLNRRTGIRVRPVDGPKELAFSLAGGRAPGGDPPRASLSSRRSDL